jgi:hypothetical protein
MPTPQFDVVWEVLHAHDRGAAIHRALSEAWTDYYEYPQHVWWRRRSTRAAIVWEHAVDRLVAEIDKIGIVAREKKKILWHFELDAEGGIEQPTPLFPLNPSPDPAGDRIVQHKKSATEIDEKKKQGGDDSNEKE